MRLLSVAEAARISGIPERTLRFKIDEGVLTKHEDEEKKRMLVEKREVLSIIPTMITIFNHKGGCGKTTLSVLLSDYYEKKNIKILLVDFDPQMNLTKTFISYKQIQDSKSLYNFFSSNTSLNKIVMDINKNISILPNNINLNEEKNYDIPDLYSFSESFKRLFKQYQIIIIDCPPGVNFLSKLGLILSNYLFIPYMPEPYNYDGLVGAIKFKSKYSEFMKSFIDFRIIISAHEQRKINIHELYINRIKEEAGEQYIFKNSIPNFVGLKERGSSFTNIFDSFAKSDKAMNKLEKVLDEIDKTIYDNRGNK